MENENVVLKPKKKKGISKLNALFETRGKRALFLVLFILPFLAAMAIFGTVAYKEVKNIISLVSGGQEIKDEYQVPSMGYVLRSNATDYQFEAFSEMRQGIADGSLDDKTIAGLVAKNYVIDFFTWTNKQGQYDVGGMYYIYDGEFLDGEDFKENVFMKARTTYYKYLNSYINTYGVENLLEVENAQVINCEKTANYTINEHVANKQDENGEWYDYREDHEFETYKVTVAWSYKVNEKFDSSSYPTKMYFVIIKEGEKFAIVEASDKDIDVASIVQAQNSEESEEELEESEIDVEDIEEEE